MVEGADGRIEGETVILACTGTIHEAVHDIIGATAYGVGCLLPQVVVHVCGSWLAALDDEVFIRCASQRTQAEMV